MARLIYSERAFSDPDRIFEHLAEQDPGAAATAVSVIREAVTVLDRHPLIGRPAEGGMRELVISRGKTGYVALYRYLSGQDVILVLAVRHQRELGYPED